MSRFDVNKFRPPPDEEFICGICMHILDMPQESPCRHVFCKVCIKQALQDKLRCPICRTPFKESMLKDVLPLVQNMLNKLTMVCDNFNNGCKELIPMERFINHVASCNYVMVSCKFSNCGLSLLKVNLSHHETKECIYRDVTCTEGCGLSITWKDRQNHKCLNALLSFKDELSNKNQLLESKIDDLNSIISALNAKLHECESKNLNKKEDDSNSNPERSPSVTSVHSFSDIGSPTPTPSYSSLNSNIYDDYEDYHSDSFSEPSYDGQQDQIDYEDYFPERHVSGNEDSEPAEFDPEYAANENRETNGDWLSLVNQSNLVASHLESGASGGDVYQYDIDGSEQVREDIVSPVESNPSIQVSVMVSSSGGPGESVDANTSGGGVNVNSRKRFQLSAGTDVVLSKRPRHDDEESHNFINNDSTIRRSRRLQNREPSPASEIPYVQVPPSASYLLDTYANTEDSSDDESWSPSQAL